MSRPSVCILAILIGTVPPHVLPAAEPPIADQPLSPEVAHVPRRLLPLVHTPQVQKELGLTGTALEEFLVELREIDAVWWPARNTPAPERREIVAKLEKHLLESLRDIVGVDAVKRLRQLELQAQGTRALARPDLAEFLGLTPAQSKQLAAAFAATDTAATQFASSGGSADSLYKTALRDAKDAEQSLVDKTLASLQKQKLLSVLGDPFEISGLERVYPLAPELIDSGHWTTDEPVTLAGLEGRVVLLHFYAFQCHNCHANFPIYKRWHDTLAGKGVTVIGIQTPETSAEHDVLKVKQAAADQGFEFPVLIDVNNENWDAWGNTMWPTVYIIDQQGYIRGWWQGELNWNGATGDENIEKIVTKLLQE